MGKKVTDELIATVRSIVGQEYSNMDVIRALHMANNDATAAINVIFDTPSFRKSENPRKSEVLNRISTPKSQFGAVNSTPNGVFSDLDNDGANPRIVDSKPNGLNPRREMDSNFDEEIGKDWSGGSSSSGSKWWFVGCGEVAGLSTCKGRKIKPGDKLNFTFPPKRRLSGPSPVKFGGGRGRQPTACSEIVRFSTLASGEIGRIPNEWSRCLLPLVRDNKVQIEGICKSTPDLLGLMDTIHLSVSLYINSSLFRKGHQASLKASSSSTDETVIHPLPTLFRLLGIAPFKKAEFTPGYLYTRKRPLNVKESSGVPAPMFHANKIKNPSSNGNEVETEESISENDLDNIVGVGNSSELQEMEPPCTLLCELRPYQKQALHWMIQLEKGQCIDDAATTLHPCWDAYHLADKREFIVYVNAFSGDATIEFPSTLQMARGGILADAMGLGKTIMTISLLLAHTERGGSIDRESTSQSCSGSSEVGNASDQSSSAPKRAAKFSGFDKLGKQQNSLIGGGNLIICPMTLIGQWKAEIETHGQPGSLSIYVHYGQSRPKDTKILAQSDVVLTTYGVLASEFSAENAEDHGGLYSVRWFRVVLDEAHTIKSSKSQISMAAAALVADGR